MVAYKREDKLILSAKSGTKHQNKKYKMRSGVRMAQLQKHQSKTNRCIRGWKENGKKTVVVIAKATKYKYLETRNGRT